MFRFFLLALFLLTAFPAEADTDVIHNVYTSLSKDYINNISPREITKKGLGVLMGLDSQIKIKISKQKLYLYYHEDPIATYDLPKDQENISSWVKLNQEVIAKAIEVSPKVELLDFEIPDRFAAAVFKGLDGYSHYYGEFSEQKKQKKIVRRNYAERKIEDVLLIKILNFHKGVHQKVLNAVNNCPDCKGLILDLRGNHGGVLDEGLKITDLFLDEGIITYTEGKDRTPPQYYTAAAGDVFKHKPIVILIDGFSASASEVLSAALSEQNRAVLIGTQTFGKGSIQDVVKMGGQSAAAITTSYFYTPSGNPINKKGLKPHICTGGLKNADNLTSGVCDPSDRFNEETDVEIAVKYIKNEL